MPSTADASFTRTRSGHDTIQLIFEDRPIEAAPGDTVAAALLAAGVIAFRDTAISGVARGPWCMMGVCFDCLVEIDGVANRQACMTRVTSGMRVRRQRGAKALA